MTPQHRRSHCSGPPASLRRAKLDNLAVVLASMLPYKQQWQPVANALPAGSALIILPVGQSKQRQTLERVGQLLRAKGHRVTILTTEQVAGM